MFVFFTWREQQVAFAYVAAVAILQQILHVIGTHAAEQLESFEQRAFVVRIDGQ
jgi:hypothetical protein